MATTIRSEVIEQGKTVVASWLWWWNSWPTKSQPRRNEGTTILYLVTMENLDQGPVAPQQMVQMMEQMVIPTMEIALKLQAEKKVMASGGPVGSRAGVMIVDAASNEELNALLQSLPLWPISRTTVVPLVSMKSQLDGARKMLETLKGMTAHR